MNFAGVKGENLMVVEENKAHHILIKRKIYLDEPAMEVTRILGDFNMDIRTIEKGHDWKNFKGERAIKYIADVQFIGQVTLEYIRDDNKVVIQHEEIIEEEFLKLSFYPNIKKTDLQVERIFNYTLSNYLQYLCIYIVVKVFPS